MLSLERVRCEMSSGGLSAMSSDVQARARVFPSHETAHACARAWPGMRCRTYERLVRAGGVNITVYVVIATPALVKKGWAP